GRIDGAPVQQALAIARDLELYDDRWFLANVRGGKGNKSGTDVVCDSLSKGEGTDWLKIVHATGDASPGGLIAAVGWDVVLTKTANDALLVALDALVAKLGLAAATGATTGATQPARHDEEEIPDFSVDSMPPLDGEGFEAGEEMPFHAPPR